MQWSLENNNGKSSYPFSLKHTIHERTEKYAVKKKARELVNFKSIIETIQSILLWQMNHGAWSQNLLA